MESRGVGSVDNCEEGSSRGRSGESIAGGEVTSE